MALACGTLRDVLGLGLVQAALVVLAMGLSRRWLIRASIETC